MTTETVTALRVWSDTTLDGKPRWLCIGRRADRSILKAGTLDMWQAALWRESHLKPIAVTHQPSASGRYINLVRVEEPEGAPAA